MNVCSTASLAASQVSEARPGRPGKNKGSLLPIFPQHLWYLGKCGKSALQERHLSLTAIDVFEGDDAQEPLTRLGLSREILTNVLKKALDAALSCNDNDPITMAGMMLWGKGVRFFAEETRPLGWKRIEVNNQALVLSPDGSNAVTAASGDEDTGVPHGSPCTRSKKGKTTIAACRDNRQRSFDDWLDPAPVVASSRIPGRATWLLLMHRDKKSNVLRAELSLPVQMDDDGHIVRWDKRIILPDVPFDSIPTISTRGNGGQDGQSPEVTVQITRLG